MAVVRLPKTGPVVLTSDVCYLMENLQKDILPNVALAYNPAGMLDGYAWIKHLMSAEGADVILRTMPRPSKGTNNRRNITNTVDGLPSELLVAA